MERVVVGYTGGEELDPTYQSIKDSTEAVLIEFDPAVISYEMILDVWAKTHSPFFPQKCQYRSAIWYSNERQREAALEAIVNIKKRYEEPREVFADIEPMTPFYRAEEYHQDFLNKQTSTSAI